jgi:hypothetical protein
MARKINLSKPLSKADLAYLQSRFPQSRVDWMVAQAGKQEETDPSEPENQPENPGGSDNGQTGTDGENGSQTGEEDLIGSTPEFNPGEHTVEEVVAYLKEASDEEKARVVAQEADGKGRSTILNS